MALLAWYCSSRDGCSDENGPPNCWSAPFKSSSAPRFWPDLVKIVKGLLEIYLRLLIDPLDLSIYFFYAT